MKKIMVFFAVMLVFSSVRASDNYGDRIIVKYRDGISAAELAEFANRNGIKDSGRAAVISFVETKYGLTGAGAHLKNIPFKCYRVKDKTLVKTTVKNLMQESVVEYAEPDYIRKMFAGPSNDTYVGTQWGYHKVSASAAYDAGLISPSLNREVIVAVLDSGVDTNHEDLKNVIMPGYNAVAGNYLPEDDEGHGSHVAGIIAAQTNNSAGIAGVAYTTGTAKVTIMPVKVIDFNGDAYDSQIYSGMRYAADNGADILNCSFGGPNSSLTVQNGVNYAVQAGCLIVAASGNIMPGQVEGDDIVYPAGFPSVLSVGSVDSSDNRSSFSVYGKVDVMAPGEGILSCTNTAVNAYTTLDGTSFAAPFASGLAALLMLKDGLDASKTRMRIEFTCDDINTPGYDRYTGWGRINVLSAMTDSSYDPGIIKTETYNWPNPFSPDRDTGTNITFRLKKKMPVDLIIYDGAGNQVWKKELREDETIAGYNNVRWNAKGDNGTPAENGVYFYVIRSGNSVIGKNKIAVLY